MLPYPVANTEDLEKYYDEVMCPQELDGVHYKSAITKRNEWFVEHSDLLVAYVVRDYGGAAQCLKFAIDHGIEIKWIVKETV